MELRSFPRPRRPSKKRYWNTAAVEIGGQKVLVQSLENDFDLDSWLERNPSAIRRLPAGI
jgi:hypothetical protein